MKVALIHRHEGQHTVALMCRVLTLSRSGYYDWRGRPPSKRVQANAHLAADIHRVYAEHKARAGAPRVTQHLRDEGQTVGKNRVARVMQAEQLRAKAARKYKATTHSNHHLPVAPNRLEQDFTAPAANQKWVSDITYVWTDEGWLYFAVVLDLYSRLVVGWAMAERMTADLVCEALTMALWRRKWPIGVIVHSDRGSQYCSADHRRLLRDHHLLCSMSKKGDCYESLPHEVLWAQRGDGVLEPQPQGRSHPR